MTSFLLEDIYDWAGQTVFCFTAFSKKKKVRQWFKKKKEFAGVEEFTSLRFNHNIAIY